MQSDYFSVFSEAADYLFSKYHEQKLNDTPQSFIHPVIIILSGTVEGFDTVPRTHSNQKLDYGLTLSQLEDDKGIVHELQYQKYTIITPPFFIPRHGSETGDRIIAYIMMGIKPHGSLGNHQWSINYHNHGGTNRLGFIGIVLLKKI